MVALILAGGWGKRFGGHQAGDKQLATVDEDECTLVDYALYDAIRAGVTRAVIVVAKENAARFAQTVGVRIGGKLSVEYVEQTPPAVYGFDEDCPPLGTGHAFLCGAQGLKEPFVVMNADDFYGREAIAQAVDLSAMGEFGCVAYPAGKTVARTPVHRGICLTEKDKLVGICECTLCRDAVGKLYAEDDTCRRYVSENTAVNMNLYAMQPAIVPTAAKCFATFLAQNARPECYLGDVISEFVGRTHSLFKVVRAKSRWYGLTYAEDLRRVRAAIAKLRRAGEYPPHLWA